MSARKELDVTNKLVLALAIALLAPPALAAKDKTLTLEFVPQEATGTHAPTLSEPMTTRAVALRLEDARGGADPDVVGQGEDDDDNSFTWRASNSVPKYAEDVLRRVATEWGIRIDAGADLKLVVRLNKFHVTEGDQAVGSMYGTEVRVTGVLEDRSGETLATGTGSGSANRYGRKRSADNSNEVLSDALKEAYARLLDDSAIQAAWDGKATAAAPSGSAPSASPSGDAVTPASLLVEVEDLVRQDFSDELIIRFINQKTLARGFSADDLRAWKDAGLSEKVIAAAMDRAAEK